MLTDKKNVLQLAALLKAFRIRRAVLCPGSRNIPIVKTLSGTEGFSCYPVTDERSAGFFALGLALKENAPVAVCCTSGSALVNLYPAVAEAFYQQIPLVVISADRPQRWIGQMDGQTMPQYGVFGNLVKRSVSLPEVESEADEWYCNRLINEALLELCHHGTGPVHINVPIEEPFFEFPVEGLPDVRVIRRFRKNETGMELYLADRLKRFRCRMAVAGQMRPDEAVPAAAMGEKLAGHFVWISDHLSNGKLPAASIKNMDMLLCLLSQKEKSGFRPELLVTYGGHILSKPLKRFLRENPPLEHWHISPDGEVTDLFTALTAVFEMDADDFFKAAAPFLEKDETGFPGLWNRLAASRPEVRFGYSEMGAVGRIVTGLPEASVLHLANSSAVRYSQFFQLPERVKVFSNRGINGIEGSLSTALGYAAVSEELNFIIIGDLSFFYDMNALWIPACGPNVRILVLNNFGGEIFYNLKGLSLDEDSERFVSAAHDSSVRAWTVDRGFEYLHAGNAEELAEAAVRFLDPEKKAAPLVLEVFTDKERDAAMLRDYFDSIR